MLTRCKIRSAGMSRLASTMAFTTGRRAASYAARPSAGVRDEANDQASTRASTTAWDPPLAPTGYMGWAASPSRVTRPVPQNGSGSRSTIGYSRICGACVISAGTSSQSNVQSANHGSTSSSRPRRFQFAAVAEPSGTLTSATQLISARPRSSAWREIG